MGPIAWKTGDTYKVALFYRYVVVEDTSKLIEKFTNICGSLGLLGRILVGKEGINGTLAGSVESIDQFAVVLKCDERFKLIDMKYSTGIGLFLPFLNLSIREVDEIVSSGAMKTIIDQNIQFDSSTFGGITGTGVHLKPNEFHEAIKRKDGVVLDIRNKFEYDIGHFDGSIGLDTFYYSETWDALDSILSEKCGTNKDQNCKPTPLRTTNDSVDGDTLSTATQASPLNSPGPPSVVTTTPSPTTTAPIVQDTNIYMYCTGGIRCEKASAYLRAKGFNNVYQLEGGIHKYLEEYPQGGTFHGKNFVFDSRVSMGPTSAETAETATGSANTTLPQPEQNKVESSSSSSAVGFSDANRELNDVSNSEDRSDETIVHQAVVGRCIDCSAPHDTYSGYIACTVCRMPVLVCPQCVTSSAHPGEYHCVRHRDLKEAYFTVLDRYSPAELRAQRDALQKLLDDSLQQNKAAVERALRERTAMKRSRKSRSTECTAVDKPIKGDVTTDTTKPEPSNTAAAANASQSKNRRNTLRKQIERITALIDRKHAEPDLGPVLLGQQKNEQIPITSSETSATTEAVSPPSFVSAVERVGVESVDPAAVPGVLNPKSRGGWGFWRS